MDNFSYLSVLVSIVLGLGITNLLLAVATLVRNRSRLRMYWPAPVWITTLFLIHVQTWWAMFGLREVASWSFAAFLIVLLQPVALFLMAAVISPQVPPAGVTDLRSQYFSEARWFFGTLAGALIISLAKDVVLYGKLPELPNLVAHAVFIAAALAGAVSRSDLVHKILAPLGLVLFGGYIALLFTRLS
jgi:hypothetical protein